jgi:hypothetical protein
MNFELTLEQEWLQLEAHYDKEQTDLRYDRSVSLYDLSSSTDSDEPLIDEYEDEDEDDYREVNLIHEGHHP